jgi:hypothetical protein
MGRLTLQLLGGFSIRPGSGPALSLGTKKAQALIAYLAVPPGRAHPRDKLASLLWGDTGDEQAVRRGGWCASTGFMSPTVNRPGIWLKLAVHDLSASITTLVWRMASVQSPDQPSNCQPGSGTVVSVTVPVRGAKLHV